MNSNKDNFKVRTLSVSPEDNRMFRQETKDTHLQPCLVPSDNFGQMTTVIFDGCTYGVYGSRRNSVTLPEMASSPLSSSQYLSSSQQQVDCNKSPTPPSLPQSVSKRTSGLGSKPMHTCSVCGDRAFYVFYGALACDSCRTFFRRQVLQSKTLICHFKGSCQVQLNTRKDCAKCRLEKCVRVGMKNSLVAVNDVAESVTNESEQDSSNEKSETPPNKSSVVGMCSDLDINLKEKASESPAASGSKPESPYCPRKPGVQPENIDSSATMYRSKSGQDMNKVNGSVVYKSKKHMALHKDCETVNNKDLKSNLNDESVVRPSLVAKKILSKPTNFAVKVTNPKTGSVREVNLSNLSSTEQEKLLELLEVAKKLGVKLENNNPNGDENTSEPLMFNLCNVIYLATAKLVAAIESLKSFNFLPHDDRLVLLKGSISEMIFLWSDISSLTSDPRLPIDVLKAAKHEDLSLYQEYDKFVADFDIDLGQDYLLINILVAICLFNPDRDELSEKDHVRCERSLYKSLLKKYLDSITSPQESPSIFAKLTRKIEDLTSLKEIYESSEVDPDDINQLVRTTKLLDIQNVM